MLPFSITLNLGARRRATGGGGFTGGPERARCLPEDSSCLHPNSGPRGISRPHFSIVPVGSPHSLKTVTSGRAVGWTCRIQHTPTTASINIWSICSAGSQGLFLQRPRSIQSGSEAPGIIRVCTGPCLTTSSFPGNSPSNEGPLSLSLCFFLSGDLLLHSGPCARMVSYKL